MSNYKELSASKIRTVVGGGKYDKKGYNLGVNVGKFVKGSQFLYGDDTLKQVESDSLKMVEFLNSKVARADVVYLGTVKTADEATKFVKAMNMIR